MRSAGEHLAFNVLAARTNAPGFVSIALLDPRGHELARKHSGVGPDPYMEYRFQEAGDYFLPFIPGALRTSLPFSKMTS